MTTITSTEYAFAKAMAEECLVAAIMPPGLDCEGMQDFIEADTRNFQQMTHCLGLMQSYVMSRSSPKEAAIHHQEMVQLVNRYRYFLGENHARRREARAERAAHCAIAIAKGV